MSEVNHATSQDRLLKSKSPKFSIEEIQYFAHQVYALEGSLSPLGSERDQNFLIDTADGGQFGLKVANSAEDPAILDMQIKALAHISDVDPGLPIPQALLSRSGSAVEQIIGENGARHSVRVLSYLSGVTPKVDPEDYSFFRSLGKCLARLSLALRGFFHPAANYDLLWDLKHTQKLRYYQKYITDAKQQEMVSYFLDRFERHVLPFIPKLRAQIVHNDFVPDNILVDENDPKKIVGIIDFGDLTHTLLVIDLATSIAASLRGHSDPVGAAAQVVGGYHEISPLEPEELRLLYDLVGARLVMLNVIASWRETIHPENYAYITGGVERTWKVLEKWYAQEPKAVKKKFFRTCGLWEESREEKRKSELNQPLESQLSRRKRLLGPGLRLFYKQPLHIVRGEGVWLFDADGNRYLDVYNNVAHVGHCHPHVVEAIAAQARQLNTNTRYLHGLILELAERITSRMPEPLSVCMFVCTGSEANELAWRLSQVATGNSGALITKFSYHGSTTATSHLSTESISEENLLPHVQTIHAPSSNTEFPQPDAGIFAAIKDLDGQGHRPAMLILDTSFVSDGIYTSPPGYLSALFEATRAEGGLCVADEVQGGFGRFGEHFWGFHYDDVIPDIVTMGKPMGNGHPIAAVVTKPEIAAALAAHTGYFNTFGGNPVSCAAGLAVLDVIEKENLQQNALEVGLHLKKGFQGLKSDYSQIGQLHGAGLLQGVDIVNFDGDPDPELANRIFNNLREKGILIGTTGKEGHVLKIRPPLVFERKHVDILLAGLEQALKDFGSSGD